MQSGLRHLAIISHDMVMAGLAVVLAFHLRLGRDALGPYGDAMLYATPIFMVLAGLVFVAFGLHRAVWRYAALADLQAIVQAATLAILVFLPVMFLLDRLASVPRSLPVIAWLLLLVLLGGPRLAWRLLAGTGGPRLVRRRSDPRKAVLLVGACDGAALFIRAMAGSRTAPYRVAGVLDDEGGKVGRAIDGVPVLGGIEALEAVVARQAQRGTRLQRLILCRPEGEGGEGGQGGQGGGLKGAALAALALRAEALGLSVSRLPSLVAFERAASAGRIELRPLALEDLLGRPEVTLDRAAIGALIGGRRVLVTGAGGSIGSELSRQIADQGPALVILADHGEYNLYRIDQELAERQPGVARLALLLDIRERDKVMRLFARHRPELVFHAAALKHVPLVEANPAAGVATNVLGTMNLADAARAHGVQAMVQVSSDKAVNPASVMGATKRLGEFYCQALDLAQRRGANGANGGANGGGGEGARFMTVRFGNVLGSSGSVVPLFQRQLEKGGPLTVTHPEIRRYFMTVREAVELVLQASAHGVAHPEARGFVFVLDMGRPIRILDIARQIIRQAGLEPETDVPIVFTGLRPGEKLAEELFDQGEERLDAVVSGVQAALPRPIELAILGRLFAELDAAARDDDAPAIRRLIAHGVPGYRPAAVPEEAPCAVFAARPAKPGMAP
jgi:FlaA1/EpsC-like NDP-sugar epimerase